MSTAAEIEALRAATREAHEALKDLRTERRAVQQLVDGIEGRVQRAVAALIETQVTEQLAALGKVTRKAMDDSVAKVHREFDRLERIFTGRDNSHEPLEDLILRRQGRSL